MKKFITFKFASKQIFIPFISLLEMCIFIWYKYKYPEPYQYIIVILLQKFSMVLFISLFLIQRVKQKKLLEFTTELIQASVYVKEKPITFRKYLLQNFLIFIFSFLQILFYSIIYFKNCSIYLFYQAENNAIILYTLNIIISALISAILLKIKIYTHNILSMLTIALLLIIMFIIFLNSNDNFDLSFYHLFIFIEALINSCFANYQKFLMDKKYMEYFSFVFFMGMYGIITLIIFNLALQNIKCPSTWNICQMDGGQTKNFLLEKKFFTDSLKYIFSSFGRAMLFFLLLILYTFKYFCEANINKMYTPTFVSNGEIIGVLLITFISPILKKEENFTLAYISIYVLSIFLVIFLLIYNEIIIINFCEMSSEDNNYHLHARGNSVNSNSSIDGDQVTKFKENYNTQKIEIEKEKDINDTGNSGDSMDSLLLVEVSRKSINKKSKLSTTDYKKYFE